MPSSLLKNYFSNFPTNSPMQLQQHQHQQQQLQQHQQASRGLVNIDFNTFHQGNNSHFHNFNPFLNMAAAAAAAAAASSSSSSSISSANGNFIFQSGKH